MSKNLKDEYAYLDALCKAIDNVKAFRDLFETSLTALNSHRKKLTRKQKDKEIVDRLISSFLTFAQEERQFHSWKENLADLNFDVLRSNRNFRNFYEKKIEKVVGMPLSVIPSDYLQSILADMINKYAHRNFFGMKDVRDSIKYLSKSDTYLSNAHGLEINMKAKQILDRMIGLYRKSVTINLRYVYENGKIRELNWQKKKIPTATIELDVVSEITKLCDVLNEAYNSNTEQPRLEQIDLFEKNYFKEFSNFTGTTIEEGFEFFVKNFDKISQGTEFEKFPEDRKRSFLEIVKGSLEMEEILQSYEHEMPKDLEQSQTDVVLSKIFVCMDKACYGSLFRGDGVFSSSCSFVYFIDAAYPYQKEIDSECNGYYIRSGGFEPMYTELLLTCVETMIQIVQYEKNPKWFEQLSQQGVIKEILDDFNEDGKKYTCTKLLATIRNSIVHAQYIVLPSRSQEFGVEFYDKKKLTVEEQKQGKKPENELKFTLGVSDLEELLAQGHDFLKSVANPEGQDDLNDVVDTSLFHSKTEGGRSLNG